MTPPTSGKRLEFLDGLRAVAMLIVLNFHCLTSVNEGNSNVAIDFLRRFTLHGQVGVVIFIVLSGYCLTIPVATAGDNRVRGGLRNFFRRRSLRLLPAYYMALTASILLAWGTTYVSAHSHSGVRSFANVLTQRNILTHLLLVHDLWLDTAFSINGALWSVATEFQIYIVFALLLLPLLRRFGLWFTLGVAFLLGISPSLLLPVDQSYYWAHPWYLGLFGLGMVGAMLNFSPHYRAHQATIRALSLYSFIGSASFLVLWHLIRGIAPSWQIDSVIGLTTTAFIVYCVDLKTFAAKNRPERVARIAIQALEARWLLYLASISYSVYLIQHIFFKGITTLAATHHASVPTVVLLNFLLGVPACFFCAHFFAKWFETPFIRMRARVD